MEETKLHPDQLDVVQANNGLRMYLSGLSTGHAATPRSSLYNLKTVENLSPDEILERWQSKLSVLETGTDYEKKVFQFDSHQLEKWGPQGKVAPIDELLEDIVYPSFSASDRPSAFGSGDAAWWCAKRNVEKKLHRAGCVGLSPVPYHRVVDDMRARDTLESNSGWPLFTRRSKPEVVAQSIEAAETGLWHTFPAIALFRNYNQKTRLVWMFPMSANLVEGSFFQPLQSILMKSEFSSLFLSPWAGFESVRSLVTKEYASGSFLAASDFSSTDAHFKLSASMEVYDVLKTCFQPRFRHALLESIVYMHRIPLVIGSDRMLTGDHGVSSGSNWTNFIETIFDWILSEYVAIKTRQQHIGLYAIGDDMSWKSLKYDPKFAEFLAKIGKRVGQEIKAEKTTNDQDEVKSLQRLFVRGELRPDGQIRAVYPTIRALKSLVYPERFHKPKLWSKDMEAVRAFMILENCVDHPLFHEFCEFVVAGDPNLLTVSKLKSSAQDSLYRASKLIPGLNATYNQEKRNLSLSQFDSVKFISTL